MTQSEEVLEQGLIKALQEMSYEYVSIKEEENLYANFKAQLEKHNRKELASHGREHFTEKEFDKILLYLEGGTRFEKAKKLRDLKNFQLENGERVWIEFINKQQWCKHALLCQQSQQRLQIHLQLDRQRKRALQRPQ